MNVENLTKFDQKFQVRVSPNPQPTSPEIIRSKHQRLGSTEMMMRALKEMAVMMMRVMAKTEGKPGISKSMRTVRLRLRLRLRSSYFVHCLVVYSEQNVPPKSESSECPL